MSPLDNRTIARILGEIGDLLELKGDNPFKVRAYRHAADVVANTPEPAAGRDAKTLQQWPGIGKDLAARIVEIGATGSCGIRDELLTQFPPTLLDLLRLQGVGPRTVALLYGELGIASLDDLEAAATAQDLGQQPPGHLRVVDDQDPQHQISRRIVSSSRSWSKAPLTM